MVKTQPKSADNEAVYEKQEQLMQQLAEMEANWKRALADYQNLQKRISQQQQVLAEIACINLVERLLPVYDHLELAAAHLNDPGLDMVIRQFTAALKDEGVEQINPLQQSFDPTKMEAVDKVPGENNQVIEVVSKGYCIGDRVIRAAKVKVGQGEN